MVGWLEWMYGVVLLCCGLMVGSFLNVVIFRLPERLEWEYWQDAAAAGGDLVLGVGELPFGNPPPGIVHERSRCRSCGHVLSWWENVPGAGWFLLRGCCRWCGASISVQYPLVEWLTGILFVVCGWVGMVVWGKPFWGGVLGGLLLTGCLVVLSGIDLRSKWLPDGLTLSVLWLGLGFSLVWGGDLPDGRPVVLAEGGGLEVIPLDAAVLGAMTGYVVLWVVAKGFRLMTGREGMGRGDFKLLAGLGAWCGVMGVVWIVLLSSVVGVVFGVVWRKFHGGDEEIPFGPSLSFAGWCVYVFGVPVLF